MSSSRIQFYAVGVIPADHISCKFYDGKLHAKAEAEERNLVFSCIADGADHAVNTTVAEAARYQDTGNIS